jgi:hypothetical protein
MYTPNILQMIGPALVVAFPEIALWRADAT